MSVYSDDACSPLFTLEPPIFYILSLITIYPQFHVTEGLLLLSLLITLRHGAELRLAIASDSLPLA